MARGTTVNRWGAEQQTEHTTMKTRLLLSLMCILLAQWIYAQTDTTPPLKYSSSVWGNIFTAFYYLPGQKAMPDKGFELSTGLLGYRGQWGDKATATLIYDVFRTTDRIEVRDTNGTSLDVLYGSRGSDYTGFLKMAQIDYKVNSWLDFSVGQLLNQQYLTYQDRFWGFRYIAFTFQEMNRFGAQADFGARFTVRPHKTLAVTVGSVNGNGPFRVQSADGNLQYFTNIEWTPVNGLMVKFFADQLSGKGAPDRNAYSFFTGYKTNDWRLGVEVNHVENHLNDESNDLSGTSIYGAYRVAEKWHLLARHDYIRKSMALENAHYLLCGFEYEPHKGFFTSLNYRYLSQGDISYLYASFGTRF
jgi:hypothetical protein